MYSSMQRLVAQAIQYHSLGFKCRTQRPAWRDINKDSGYLCPAHPALTHGSQLFGEYITVVHRGVLAPQCMYGVISSIRQEATKPHRPRNPTGAARSHCTLSRIKARTRDRAITNHLHRDHTTRTATPPGRSSLADRTTSRILACSGTRGAVVRAGRQAGLSPSASPPLSL